ncbi:unnamed protein product, partial [Brenthis ino]
MSVDPTKSQPSTLEVKPPQKRLRLTQTRLTVPKKIAQNPGDSALINMIVKDYQPFQIVENSGFQQYTKALNADYELPRRKKLVLMIDEKYKLESESLKKELQDVCYLALTSDIWSSDSNKNFISLTAHFIEHTINNAAAMKKAISECLNKRNHFCVAHTINLAVKDCLEKRTFDLEENTAVTSNNQLQQLLAKCRAIVSYFKYSTKASYALLKMQEQLKVDTLKLKQDVRARWNSTFYMLERLLDVKISLSATLPLLESLPSNLDSNEWLLTEDAMTLLRPYFFKNVTAILSGEKYPTLSSVIPLVLGLRKAIDSNTPVTESGKRLKSSLSSVIEKRLGVYETNRTASKATFLEPRFKKRGFVLESNANNAQMWVLNEISNMSSNQDIPPSSASSPSTPIASATANTTDLGTDDIWEVVDKKPWRPLLSQLHTLRQL